MVDDDNSGNVYADSVPGRGRASKGKKKTNWVLWIVLGLVGVGLALVLCCGGLGYYGLNFATEFIKESYENHPTMQEQIGTVEEFSMNFVASGEAEKKSPTNKVVIFDVSGSKGSGELWFEQTADNKFVSAELRMNGEVFNLGEPNPPEGGAWE